MVSSLDQLMGLCQRNKILNGNLVIASSSTTYYYKLVLKIIVFIKFRQHSTTIQYHELKLWKIIRREEENECNGSLPSSHMRCRLWKWSCHFTNKFWCLEIKAYYQQQIKVAHIFQNFIFHGRQLVQNAPLNVGHKLGPVTHVKFITDLLFVTFSLSNWEVLSHTLVSVVSFNSPSWAKIEQESSWVITHGFQDGSKHGWVENCHIKIKVSFYNKVMIFF